MTQLEGRKRFALSRSANYRIRVEGLLDESCSKKLGGLHITSSSLKDKRLVTDLIGRMRDQAELVGVVNTLYNLHLTLLSVEYLNDD